MAAGFLYDTAASIRTLFITPKKYYHVTVHDFTTKDENVWTPVSTCIDVFDSRAAAEVALDDICTTQGLLHRKICRRFVAHASDLGTCKCIADGHASAIEVLGIVRKVIDW